MRIVVAAVFDGEQWEAPSSFRRGAKMVDVITTERPAVGDVVEGRLAEIVDEDSYEARRIVARDTFGGEAFLAIGDRAPAGRPA